MPKTSDHRPRFWIHTEYELQHLPGPSWLIEDLIPWGGLTVLYGPPGAGKSFLSLAWAMAVARGAEWLGHNVTWSPALYVAAEGGRGLVHRMAAYREAVGESERPSDSAFFVFDSPNLLDPRDVDTFLADVRRSSLPGNPGLVVLDPLARMMPGGEENSAKDLGLVVAAVDRIRHELNTAVLLDHHTTKSGDAERGSSALRAAADAMFSVKNRGGLLTLEQVKAKDSELLPVCHLRLQRCGPSCVVEPADGASSIQPDLSPNDVRVLRALFEHHAPGETGTRPPHETAGLSRATFYRCLSRLQRCGYVVKSKAGWLVTADGERLVSSSHTGLKGVS